VNHLVAELDDLQALHGANLILICRPTDDISEHCMRFVDGQADRVSLQTAKAAQDEPVAVVSGTSEALAKFLRGKLGLEDPMMSIRVLSRDVGPIMVLTGILQAPTRHIGTPALAAQEARATVEN
jgi:hypothetical protein